VTVESLTAGMNRLSVVEDRNHRLQLGLVMVMITVTDMHLSGQGGIRQDAVEW